MSNRIGDLQFEVTADASAADATVQGLGKTSSSVTEQLGKLSTGLLVGGGAIVAMGKNAVSAFSTIEDYTLRASLRGGEYAETVGTLVGLTSTLAAGSAFTGAEVAKSMYIMAGSGFVTEQQITDVTLAMQDMATVARIDLPTATRLATGVLNQFQLESYRAASVTDILATAVHRTPTSIQALTGALTYASGAAVAAGFSLEETTAALGVMARSGIEGSAAGSSLGRMMTEILSPASNAAAGALERLNIQTHDYYGNVLPLPNIMGQFESGLYGMSDAQRQAYLDTIFGANGIRAFNAIAGQGVESLIELEDALGKYGAANYYATQFLQTTSGQQELMRANTMRLRESIGEALVPTMQSLNRLLETLGNFVTDNSELLSRMAPIVFSVGLAMVALGTGIKGVLAVIKTVKALKAAWAVVTGVLSAAKLVLLLKPALIIAAIAAIVAAVIWLVRNWEDVAAAITEIWGNFTEWLTGHLQRLGDFIQDIFDAIGNFLRNIWDGIVNFFQAVWSDITAIFTGDLYGISDFTWGIIDGIRGFIERIFEGIANFFRTIWEGIRNFFTRIWEAIVGVFTGAITGVTNTVRGGFDAVRNVITGIWNGISNFFGNIWGTISSTVSGALGRVSSTISNGWNNVRSFTSSGWQTISSTVSGAWNTMSTATTNAQTRMLNAARGVVNNVRNVFSNFPSLLTGAGQSLMAGLRRGIESAKNAAVNAARAAANAVRRIFPFSPAKDPSSPFFGKGWMLYSGESIMQGVADGISRGLPNAYRVAASAVSELYDALDLGAPDAPAISYSIDGVQQFDNRQTLLDGAIEVIDYERLSATLVGVLQPIFQSYGEVAYFRETAIPLGF